MRDLLSWGVSLPRMFGIPVKVHWLFFLVTGGLFFRQVMAAGNVVWWGDVFLFTVVALFTIVLVHELGHCLAGRLVGGEPQEILIWPLGGLAFVDVPHTWRANFITVAGGPAVNLVLALLCGMILAVAGFTPSPLAEPYKAVLRHPKDGREYTSEYALRLYKPGTAEPVDVPPGLADAFTRRDQFTVNQILTTAANATPPFERAQASQTVVWVYRIFFINCWMFAFNLLPAYPLDGGQLLMTVVWARRGYRRAVTVAGYSGFVVGILVMMASVAQNETLVMGLGLFMVYAAYTRLNAAEAEDTGYGDFSQGYTSLERDDPPPPARPKVGPVKKWLRARTARRIQRELEAQQADDVRMDQLLDKIARGGGKGALTDEERRFMERVSARYRNR